MNTLTANQLGDMNTLTTTQMLDMNALIAEAAAAKNRAIRQAETLINESIAIARKNVTDTEYSQRLARSLNRDKHIAEEVKQQRIEASLKDWKRKVGATFAGAKTHEPIVLDRIARLSQNKGTHKTSLVLYGNMGTGKSWTAYGFINMAIAAGVATSGQIVNDTETGVLGKITVSGYKKPELLEELLAERNKIFFIDDVGQGFFSDAQKRTEVWFELVDHIYTHQLTLLMTTNLAPKQLEAWIGPRAYDRLRTLVGNDGFFEPSKVNRRDSVLEKNEQEFMVQGFNRPNGAYAQPHMRQAR